MQADAKKQSWMYENMFKSRYYEECMEAAYLEGKQPVFNMANGPLRCWCLCPPQCRRCSICNSSTTPYRHSQGC